MPSLKAGSVVPGFLDSAQWAACFGLSWADMILYDSQRNRRIIRETGTYLRRVCGSAGIAVGRNEVAATFLDHTDGEWLWFVDSDMGFAPDTVDRLVASADASGRPVMGGLCFILHSIGEGPFYSIRNGLIPTIYRRVTRDDGMSAFSADLDYGLDRVVACDGTGAACLLIHRDALEKVRAKYGDVWFDTITQPTQGLSVHVGEDLAFCMRLMECGIPLHVDTRVKTTHFKGGRLFLDEEAFLAQRAAAQSGPN